jgi:uncharacterized protein YjbJ (UPF0337 family)
MGERQDRLTDGDGDLEQTTVAAREEIELTRAEMTSTIDAIQDRLDPEVLSEHAKDTAHDVTDYAIREAKEAAREITDHALMQAREAVRDITGQAKLAVREATIGKVETMARTATDTAGGLRHTVLETIKANPMPAALVGLGLGWMLLNRPNGSTNAWSSSSRRQPYGVWGDERHGYSGSTHGASGIAAAQEAAGHIADRAQETAGQVADQVQGTAEQMLGQVQETGAQVMDQVQEQASRAQTFLQQQLDENPLLVGAVAVAIGGMLAGTVRSTPSEDHLLGEARDRLVGSAKELTQDTMHKVGRVVDEAQSAAKQEAKDQSLVAEA